MVQLSSPLELEIEMSDEQFFALCQKHRDLQFERSATGELIIMSPTGGSTGKRNSTINFQFQVWNRRQRLGEVFDSSTGFILTKMHEYIDNGARLGWLIDPQRQIVEIYRPGGEVEILESPETVLGEEVLPGFVFELAEIF